MKSREDIENVLQRLGRAWPGQDSIVERVMRRIESAPPVAAVPKQRRILVKSLLAIAASFAACAALWWAVEGSRNSLYAQVIEGARNARTLHVTHYVQLTGKAEPTKTFEAWYEKGVGFRRDRWDARHATGRHCTVLLGNKDGTWTFDFDRPNTIVRAVSAGIAKETDQIFADIDRHARDLQNHGQRYPQSDQTFDGQSCEAYLKKSGPPELRIKSDKLRQVYYLDPQSRLVRVVTQERDGDRWNTTQFNTIGYDEPLGLAFFQPHFGKEFKIVDAGAKPGKPEAAKPEGAVLIYEVDPKSIPAGATVDMDELLRTVDVRLNGGAEGLAAVRKLNDRRIEVTLLRRSAEDRRRVERQLARPGTLEFRVLANRHVDKATVDLALKEPAKTEIRDPSGKQLAWWVPVKAGQERSCSHLEEVTKRTKQVGSRKVTEILVVADPCNITGAYLTQAKVHFDPFGRPGLVFIFNDAGGKLFGKLTGDHLPNESAGVRYWLGIIIDGELVSAPTVQSKIGNKGEITGDFTEVQASDLAAVLNGGSLPVRLRLVAESSHP
jgi:hypothetical protein